MSRQEWLAWLLVPRWISWTALFGRLDSKAANSPSGWRAMMSMGWVPGWRPKATEL